jgi:hypothetical protein
MYVYRTSKGPFYIVQRGDRWHILYDGENLGNHHSARAAASELSGGHTDFPSNGVDPGTLSIPEDLAEWEFSK